MDFSVHKPPDECLEYDQTQEIEYQLKPSEPSNRAGSVPRKFVHAPSNVFVETKCEEHAKIKSDGTELHHLPDKKNSGHSFVCDSRLCMK